MGKNSLTILLAILLSSFTCSTFAQQDQRIHAAYMLAFGRDASQAEVNYWLTRGNLSIVQLMGFHQQYISQDEGINRSTIDRAYQDALGRHANEGEITYLRKHNDTYTTLMRNHVQWLQNNPAEYENVIKRSYQYVFGRQPNPGELSYWRSQGTVCYLILVGYHQDYQRRNQKEGGNQVNLKNAPAVAIIPLSAVVAKEAKKAATISLNSSAIIIPGTVKITTYDGGTVVTAGAGNIVTHASNN